MTAPAGSGASPARDDDTRLAEIAARAAAATEGPWLVEQFGNFDRPLWQISPVLRDRYGVNVISSSDRDTIEFIAAARTDVPYLLGEVERLRAENEILRESLNLLCDGDYDVADAIMDGLRAEAERGAAVAALNRVRALCEVPAHICGETCEAFGCDHEGLTHVRSVQSIIAAADVPEAPQ